jgi:hypothetical protein
MAGDGAIRIWHQGIHWSIKREGDQYWCKETENMAWRLGLPPGMKPPDAGRAFKAASQTFVPMNPRGES